jgi:hypothetical protein
MLKFCIGTEASAGSSSTITAMLLDDALKHILLSSKNAAVAGLHLQASSLAKDAQLFRTLHAPEAVRLSVSFAGWHQRIPAGFQVAFLSTPPVRPGIACNLQSSVGVYAPNVLAAFCSQGKLLHAVPSVHVGFGWQTHLPVGEGPPVDSTGRRERDLPSKDSKHELLQVPSLDLRWRSSILPKGFACNVVVQCMPSATDAVLVESQRLHKDTDCKEEELESGAAESKFLGNSLPSAGVSNDLPSLTKRPTLVSLAIQASPVHGGWQSNGTAEASAPSPLWGVWLLQFIVQQVPHTLPRAGSHVAVLHSNSVLWALLRLARDMGQPPELCIAVSSIVSFILSEAHLFEQPLDLNGVKTLAIHTNSAVALALNVSNAVGLNSQSDFSKLEDVWQGKLGIKVHSLMMKLSV